MVTVNQSSTNDEFSLSKTDWEEYTYNFLKTELDFLDVSSEEKNLIEEVFKLFRIPTNNNNVNYNLLYVMLSFNEAVEKIVLEKDYIDNPKILNLGGEEYGLIEKAIELTKDYSFDKRKFIIVSAINAMFYRLLSPLTGEDKEWDEETIGLQARFNKRCGRIYKTKDGKIFYRGVDTKYWPSADFSVWWEEVEPIDKIILSDFPFYLTDLIEKNILITNFYYEDEELTKLISNDSKVAYKWLNDKHDEFWKEYLKNNPDTIIHQNK